MKRILLASVLAAGAFASGCAKDDLLRTEGLTLGAGDAIARNTALQVIDPWPEGVEDTDIKTPNDHGGGTTPPAPGTPVAPKP